MSSHYSSESNSVFRPDCLAGKVALVTGGGSGICFEVTKQLLKHGCAAAVICGRRQHFLERSSALLEQETGKHCKYSVCDVRDPKACQKAVLYCMEQFGRLDILVNGAAGNFLAEAKDLKPKGCVCWRLSTCSHDSVFCKTHSKTIPAHSNYSLVHVSLPTFSASPQ